MKTFLFCCIAVVAFAMMSGVARGQTTYTWNQTGTASWATSTNWTPTRTTPAADDILQFTGGGTVTVTNVPTQTIGQLLLSNSSTVNLQAAAGVTLTIGGGTGTDLDVPTGSALNCNTTNAITIALSSGATGSISGSMTFSASASTAHRLTAADASAITFNSGGTFSTGTNFSGNPFGSTNLNSVVFANGSTYVHTTGSNPFGATAPNSVVVFQTGSLYKNVGASQTPSFSGRTYANVEFAGTGTSTMTGSSAVVMDNLTVTSGTANVNMTGTPGHSIKGNISVASGATLTFTPTSAGTMNFNGSAAQSITNSGTLTFAANAAIVIANSVGVTFNQSQTISGSMTVNVGALLATSGTLTLTGTPTINGTFQINQGGFATGGTWTYTSKLVFNNSSGSYGVNNDAYWPSTNGPTDVTVQGAGGITMNVARTVSGTFQTAAGVVNGNNLTLNGTCQINQGGFFTGSPTYGGSSTLVYNNSSGSYGTGDEFPATNGPQSVTVQGAGGVTLNAARTVSGTFQTAAGVTNGNNLTVNGTCQMNTGGFFTGSPTYGGSSALVYNNGAGGFNTADEWPATNGPPNVEIKNATPVTLTASRSLSGELALTSGTLTLGANTLTIGSAGSITDASSSNYIVTNGAGVLTRSSVGATDVLFPIGTSAPSYNPVTINNAGTSDDFSARVQVGFASLPGGAPPPVDPLVVVDRAWVITEGTSGGSNATLTFQYNTGEFNAVGFDVTNNFIARHNGTQWVATAATEEDPPVSPFTSMASGFSAFSPFGITSNLNSLPVQLASFTGTFVNGSVRLNWRTISEINNYGFYVQRRSVGVLEWWTVDNSFVPGHGTTNEPHDYTFTDRTVTTGSWQYRLKQVDLHGTEHFTEPINVTTVTSVKEGAPIEFALKQNYPNPFNPETSIKFSVEQTGRATLEIFNLLGQKVATLFDDVVEAGFYQTVKFSAAGGSASGGNGASLTSGIYFYRLESGGRTEVKKLTLLK